MPAKYRLYSSAEGGVQPPCAFFFSEKGCRNGDSCKFAHTKPGDNVDVTAQIMASSEMETGSVVSSESSEGEVREHGTLEDESPFVKSRDTAAKSKQERKKDVAASKAEGQPSGEKKNRRGKRSSDDHPFANPKKKVKSTTNETTPVRHTPKKESTESPRSTASYRSLNLPVSSFPIPSGDADKAQKESKEVTQPTPKPMDKPASKLVVPKSTEAGRKWLNPVQKTQMHPRFNMSYDFEKYKTIDEQVGFGSNAWIKARDYGSWCADCPPVIAIDCEMCETQDPVSGQRDSRALCRFSVINAETDEVLLDSLVKPIWPVVDYRTFVNGIAAEHLANVEFTLRHAQAFMMALCSSETVIVGQALHNDLAALRMEHYCVADSACLFKAQDSPTATVGLRDLAASVLKKAMPEKHDSVNDARMALACVKHYMEKDGNVEAVQRSYSSKPDYVCQLFVHRIPKNVCDESHLARMFLEHTFVKPVEVEEIDFSSGASGKTRIVFKTARHANLSFDTLEGKAEPDASGRMQKKVYLRNGSYVRVRKMAFDKNSDGSSSTPRRSSTG